MRDGDVFPTHHHLPTSRGITHHQPPLTEPRDIFIPRKIHELTVLWYHHYPKTIEPKVFTIASIKSPLSPFYFPSH